jgi:uncharacterized protein (DUF58 family)
VIRNPLKIRSNDFCNSPVGEVELPDRNELHLEIDAKTLIDQVPSTWHPQYGIHMGWSMGTLLLVVVVMGSMAFVTQLGLLFWSVSLAISVFFISIVYPGWIIHSLKVTKSVPDTGIVSQPLPITITVHNTRKYFSSFSIRVAELFPEGQVAEIPRVYIPCIGPGKACTFQILVTPVKRGQLMCLGTRVASKYPFGLLARFRTVIDKRPVTVYPALGNLTAHMLPASRQNDFQVGLTQPKYRGASDEFYALREYRPGDNPRLIHWKRSARIGRLIVREMSQYSPHRLTVILDTFLTEQQPAQLALFEHMVSFTATILCHSLERGFKAGLVCSGVPPLMVPPLAGREAQHRILRTLSAVEAQFGSSLADLFHNWRFTGSWSGRCFIIALTPPSPYLITKLSEVIGPVQVFIAGSTEWRNVFAPPSSLKLEAVAGDV